VEILEAIDAERMRCAGRGAKRKTYDPGSWWYRGLPFRLPIESEPSPATGTSPAQTAGDRGREVEDPVVVARRLADEHVLEHLLDDIRSSKHRSMRAARRWKSRSPGVAGAL
jgi:hypothetical protein